MSSEASQPLTDFGPNEWLVDELHRNTSPIPTQLIRHGGISSRTTSPGTAADGSTSPAKSTVAGNGAGGAVRAAASKAAARPATATTPDGSDDALAVSKERLRGTAARTAQNMDASLTVPTATSVRAMPGQAADRQPHRDQQPPEARPRRQGLLHPPDRLRDGPGAGAGPGDERLLRRGSTASRSLVKPEHVNLGLAIDLAKADGNRQLVVPNIKAAETHELPAVLAGLRGHGPQGRAAAS